MLGAIVGDVVGSPYEFDWNNVKTTNFPLFSKGSKFTDDSVMTLAVAEALMMCGGTITNEDAVRKAVSLGGDSDTLTAITASIAEAAWGIPADIETEVMSRLDPFLRNVLERWEIWRTKRLSSSAYN